jgi:hypothetical protein
LQIWDNDGLWDTVTNAGDDDHSDITDNDADRNLDLTVNLAACLIGQAGAITGDSPGNCNTTMSVNGDADDFPAHVSFRVFMTDTVPPVLAALAQTPSKNTNGWNNSDVTIKLTCTDAQSGVNAGATTLPDVVFSSDGANQSALTAATCVDNAGNKAAQITVGGDVDIDKTPPTVTVTTIPAAPNGSGWFNSDVTVHADCSDTLSGIDGACPADQVISSEGAAVVVTIPAVSDLAGNSAASSSLTLTIKIDKTPPEVVPSGPNGRTHFVFQEVVTITPNATDGLSGIASSACETPDTFTIQALFASLFRHLTLECTATDNAGNTTTVIFKYRVSQPIGDYPPLPPLPEMAPPTPTPTPAPPSSAGGAGILFGTKPPFGGGYGTFAFAGGTLDELMAASGCPRGTVVSFFNKPDGGFAVWIPGTEIVIVNAEFIALFGGGVPAGTIFTVRCL